MCWWLDTILETTLIKVLSISNNYNKLSSFISIQESWMDSSFTDWGIIGVYLGSNNVSRWMGNTFPYTPNSEIFTGGSSYSWIGSHNITFEQIASSTCWVWVCWVCLFFLTISFIVIDTFFNIISGSIIGLT